MCKEFSCAAPKTCSLTSEVFIASLKLHNFYSLELVLFQHFIAFCLICFLQDCFLTDTSQESSLSLTPDPTLNTPEKELKGVKFSEVAVILDAEPEDFESDDDGSFHQ